LSDIESGVGGGNSSWTIIPASNRHSINVSIAAFGALGSTSRICEKRNFKTKSDTGTPKSSAEISN
jgi:hypothetical protein